MFARVTARVLTATRNYYRAIETHRENIQGVAFATTAVAVGGGVGYGAIKWGCFENWPRVVQPSAVVGTAMLVGGLTACAGGVLAPFALQCWPVAVPGVLLGAGYLAYDEWLGHPGYYYDRCGGHMYTESRKEFLKPPVVGATHIYDDTDNRKDGWLIHKELETVNRMCVKNRIYKVRGMSTCTPPQDFYTHYRLAKRLRVICEVDENGKAVDRPPADEKTDEPAGEKTDGPAGEK
jgi:hypothetical protein